MSERPQQYMVLDILELPAEDGGEATYSLVCLTFTDAPDPSAGVEQLPIVPLPEATVIVGLVEEVVLCCATDPRAIPSMFTELWAAGGVQITFVGLPAWSEILDSLPLFAFTEPAPVAVEPEADEDGH